MIEQANINHVHITTSARISIFLSQWVQSPFRHWNLHSINFLNHVCSYEIRWKSVASYLAVEKLKATIEKTSINITTSARILIFFLSQWVQNTFGHWTLHFSSFLITYVGKRFFGTNARNKCYFLCKSVTFSCRNIEGRDRTDEYKHKQPRHEFWYFYRSEWNISLAIEKNILVAFKSRM